LSYGNQDYAKSIIEEAKQRFGDKFEPLTEHMPFNQYLEILGKIDIAIFNHKRQQAFGNLINLLGLGKKVYIRKESTLNEVFQGMGIKVFDAEHVDLFHISPALAERNSKIVIKEFSESRLNESFKIWMM